MVKDMVIAALVCTAIILGYLWFAATRPAHAPAESPGGAVPQAYSWRFESAGEDASISAPKTRVILVADGVSYDGGTYYGNCREMDSSELATGEHTAAMCWWAGYGDEVGVFVEDGKTVLKHGEHMEPTAETPPFRGNFMTVLEIGR